MPTRLLLDEVTSVAFEGHQRLHTLTSNKIFRSIFLFGPPATPNLFCIASGATLGSFARRTTFKKHAALSSSPDRLCGVSG